MTEEEAAAKLCALINEIQAAGHEVATGGGADEGIWVGNAFMHEPTFGDGEWTVES